MRIIKQDSYGYYSNILHNLLAIRGYRTIKSFQQDNNLTVDGLFGINSYNKLYKLFLQVEELEFTDFIAVKAEKKQIVWHHSAGWDDSRRMFKIWQRDNRGRVATAIGINDDGRVYRGFDESMWAHHLGVRSSEFRKQGIKYKYRKNSRGKWYVANNEILNEMSIGVEVCNFGYLKKTNGKFVNYIGREMPEEKVSRTEYKGYKYFERITHKEVRSLQWWTLLNAIRFRIPVEYNPTDMWTLSKRALKGEKGLYTHNSYRKDKTDISPQAHLIKMAEDLYLFSK